MNNIAGKFKHKVEVYKKVEKTNEAGAVTYNYEKYKTIWCSIAPKLGERVRAIKKENTGMTYYSGLTYVFTMRINALKVENDMYFVYKGQRYDIDYAVPYFSNMQTQEVYCQLIIENENNLPSGEWLSD